MHRYALPIALLLLADCAPAAEKQAADVFTEAQLFHEEGDLEKAMACYNLIIVLDLRTGGCRASANTINLRALKIAVGTLRSDSVNSRLTGLLVFRAQRSCIRLG